MRFITRDQALVVAETPGAHTHLEVSNAIKVLASDIARLTAEVAQERQRADRAEAALREIRDHSECCLECDGEWAKDRAAQEVERE